jgi:hypothetical protein
MPVPLGVRFRALGPNYFADGEANYEPDDSVADPNTWANINWDSLDHVRAFVPYYNCQNYVISKPSPELIDWMSRPASYVYYGRDELGYSTEGPIAEPNSPSCNPIEVALEMWLSRRGQLDHPDFGKVEIVGE